MCLSALWSLFFCIREHSPSLHYRDEYAASVTTTTDSEMTRDAHTLYFIPSLFLYTDRSREKGNCAILTPSSRSKVRRAGE